MSRKRRRRGNRDPERQDRGLVTRRGAGAGERNGEGRAPLRLRRNAARPLHGGQSPFHTLRGGQSPFYTSSRSASRSLSLASLSCSFVGRFAFVAIACPQTMSCTSRANAEMQTFWRLVGRKAYNPRGVSSAVITADVMANAFFGQNLVGTVCAIRLSL